MSGVTSLGGVDLNNNLIWEDRWAYATADHTTTRTLGGKVVVFSAGLAAGRPITLIAREDQGWLTLEQVEAVYGIAQTPGATYPLQLVVYSDELVARPRFLSPAGWTPSGGWTLPPNRAYVDGLQVAPATLTASGVIERDGSRYCVEVRARSVSGGSLTVSIPGASGTPFSGGYSSEVLTADNAGGTGDLVITAPASVAADLDSVSVRKITDSDFTVVFRHDDSPAFNAVPLIPRQMARPGDYFTATIKLMTV